VSRDLLRLLVPRCWTGEQALAAAGLLRAALDAVWRVHGEEMAGAMGDWPVSRWEDVLPPGPPGREEIDDDEIPF